MKDLTNTNSNSYKNIALKTPSQTQMKTISESKVKGLNTISEGETPH